MVTKPENPRVTIFQYGLTTVLSSDHHCRPPRMTLPQLRPHQITLATQTGIMNNHCWSYCLTAGQKMYHHSTIYLSFSHSDAHASKDKITLWQCCQTASLFWQCA